MTYIIIGGVNGVGKSTIYTALSDVDVGTLGKRINVDEIAVSLGNWQDKDVQNKSGKLAVKQINECLASKIAFHQETTLAGRTVINTAKKAKALGYKIYLWYIYVDEVNIAKQRVHERVANGGHGVADEIIERRSVTSLNTLQALIPFCDEVWLYDNTIAYNLVAKIINGKLSLLSKNIPQKIINCLNCAQFHRSDPWTNSRTTT